MGLAVNSIWKSYLRRLGLSSRLNLQSNSVAKRKNRSATGATAEVLESRCLLSSITVNATGDNHLTNFHHDQSNLGGLDTLQFFKAGNSFYRPMVMLDLSSVSLSGGDVQGASLELFHTGNGFNNSEMSVSLRAVSRDWAEGNGFLNDRPGDGSSWLNSDTGTPWNQAGGDFDTTTDFGLGPNGLISTGTIPVFSEPGWVDFDITGAVQKWLDGEVPNHGVGLLIDDGNFIEHRFASTEHANSSIHPRVVLTTGPSLSAVPLTQSVDEDAGTATIQVQRTGGTDGTVTVDYAVNSGTATDGDDFTSSSGTLTFLPGEAVHSIDVPILEDNDDEPDESFTVDFTNPTGGVLLADSQATVTIIDNDEPFLPGEFNFTAAQVTVDETANSLVVDVLRTGGTDGAVTVGFETNDLTAIAGEDYVATSQTLNFADGQSVVQVSVPLIDDVMTEGDETFSIVLINPTGGATIGIGSSTVTIDDDDAPAVSTIVIDSITDNHLTSFQNQQANLGGRDQLQFFQGGNSLYRPLMQVDLSGLQVSALDVESATLELYHTGGGFNNLDMTVSLVPLAVPWEEGNGFLNDRPGNGSSWLNTDTGSPWTTPGGDFNTTFDFGNGSNGVIIEATIPSFASPGFLSFDITPAMTAWLDGSLPNYGFGFIIEDGFFTEHVFASSEFSNAEFRPRVTLETAQAISFQQTSITVDEDAGTATLQLQRSSNSGAASVDFTTMSGTATGGDDYTSTAGTLTFVPGETTQSIQVIINEDELEEPSEFFHVLLSNPSGAVLGASSAAVHIADNDGPPPPADPGDIALATTSVTVLEEDGSAVVGITRTNGSAGVITVDFSVQPGTAIAGNDYTDTTGSVVFADGQTSANIVVPIVDDEVPEGSESFSVAIDHVTGGATLSQPRTAIVTIQDDLPTPTTGDIRVTADDTYDLYVNGQFIGSDSELNTAELYSSVKLEEGENVLAIRATDLGSAAAVFFDMTVNSPSGPTSVVSDHDWLLSTSAPVGWEQPGFDDSSWEPASEYGRFGVSPWLTSVSGLTTASVGQWIWSDLPFVDDEIFLRLSITLQNGEVVQDDLKGDITAVTDDDFFLYVNGAFMGSGDQWNQAEVIRSVELAEGENIIAIHTHNHGGLSGVFFDWEIGGQHIVSNSNWLVQTEDETEPGWQFLGFDDSDWSHATSYGGYGAAPWLDHVAGLDPESDAQWIWTDDNAADDHVTMRFRVFVSNGEIVASEGFGAETVLLGLTQPTAIDFTGDGKIFVAQKDGIVRVAENEQLLPAPFIDMTATTNNTHDRGLLGLAAHPDFPNTPYVYLAHTYDPPETQGRHGLDGSDGFGNRVARVVRVTADPNTNFATAIPGSEVIVLGTNSTWENISHPELNSTHEIFIDPSCPEHGTLDDCIPADSTSHTIGGLAFGIDGMLYVTSGDGTSFGRVDPRTVRVQDVNSLSGKMLRIDPITGLGLSDNPFVDQQNPDLSANRSKVWSYGLRNPFRFAIHPHNGEPYIGDVGWGSWEEINTGRGANFGWPFYEGGNGTSLQTGGYSDLPEAEAFYQSGETVVAPAWSRSHSAGAIAIIVGDFYTGNVYPAEFHDTLFITDFGEPTIRAVEFDEFGDLVQTQVVMNGVGLVSQMKMGPDGLMYYADLVGGVIGRITYEFGASAPPPIQGGSGNGSANDGSADGPTPNNGIEDYTFEQAGTELVIGGTSGDDSFIYDAATPNVIAINGIDFVLADTVNTIVILGGAGEDLLTIIGSPTDDTGILRRNGIAYANDDNEQRVGADQIESFTYVESDGSNTAVDFPLTQSKVDRPLSYLGADWQYVDVSLETALSMLLD